MGFGKKAVAFAFLLLFLPLAFAQDRMDITKVGSMTSEVEISWEITSEDQLDELLLIANFIANNSNQEIVSIESSHPYALEEDGEGELKIRFELEEPPRNVLITTTSVVRTDYQEVEVTEPLPYPYPLEHEFYQSPLTAPNKGINETAQEISAGMDDTYEIVAKFSEWTHLNIDYNLEYAPISPPAIEVYEAREGTCDEYAHLLISLGRSVGIPMRFVVGYVNSGKEWDLHSWVELKTPNEWLPFDPTYNEAGKIDASHIRITSGVDQSEIRDSLKGTGDVETRLTLEKNFDIEILEYEEFDEYAEYEPSSWKRGERSEIAYLTVNNRLGEYLFVPVWLRKSAGVEVSPKARLAYVKPMDSQTVSFNLELPELEINRIYTYPLIFDTPTDSINYSFQRDTSVSIDDELGGNGGTGNREEPECLSAFIVLLPIAAVAVAGRH